MAKLGARVLTLTLAFLLITPLAPFYQLTEGYYADYEELDIIELTEGDTDFVLENIITEDGFLLKPALNTIEGDRSTTNEVFAYSVESGDTLSSIAQRFGLKKETLMWENNLWNENNVKSGMTLKILPVDGVSHMVKEGQNLAGIVKKYGVEKEVVIRQNQLENETVTANTLLIIPGAKKALPQPTYTPAPSTPPAAQLAKGSGRFLWPVDGGARLTQGFHRGHYAVDLASRAKGPVYAAASGKVVQAEYGWNGGYGNVIVVDHGEGVQTLYAHNEKLYVSEGQYVEQGQTISWMGNSGRSSGPHLHFEIRIDGVKYNPLHFF